MPRKARIDAPGALHHIIARGIERRSIFTDDSDRNHFLSRLETVLSETQTRCYAWALMPNHFHLLLRTGSASISTVMRRLLTGYFEKVVERVAELLSMDPHQVVTARKSRNAVKARSMVCFWAFSELGMSQTSLAQRFGVSQPAVSSAVRKGEKTINAAKYELFE